MLDVCGGCGAYRVDKEIEVAEAAASSSSSSSSSSPSSSLAHAICPECRHRQPFVRAPLLLVTGASGSGKSTVALVVQRAFTDAVVLDDDILWAPHFAADPHAFFETWLRLCKNIAQSGRPVVLFGAGSGVPDNLERCVQRRYLGAIHRLALVCDDAVLADRLRRRPAWRSSGGDDYVAEHVRFNDWFKRVGPTLSPPIELVDTTDATADESAAAVIAWIRARLAVQPPAI